MGVAISFCFVMVIFFAYLPLPVKSTALDNPKITDTLGFVFVIGLLITLGVSSTRALELALLVTAFFTIFIYTLVILRKIFNFWR